MQVTRNLQARYVASEKNYQAAKALTKEPRKDSAGGGELTDAKEEMERLRNALGMGVLPESGDGGESSSNAEPKLQTGLITSESSSTSSKIAVLVNDKPATHQDVTATPKPATGCQSAGKSGGKNPRPKTEDGGRRNGYRTRVPRRPGKRLYGLGGDSSANEDEDEEEDLHSCKRVTRSGKMSEAAAAGADASYEMPGKKSKPGPRPKMKK